MKIAIVGTVKKPYFGQNLAYVEYMAKFGDVILLPPNPKPDFITDTFDLLVMPGGGDVDQARYGGFNYHQGAPDVHAEYFDKNVLPHVLGKIPILGICRGMQSVCVELGCGIIQDLECHQYSSDSRDQLVHDVWQWKTSNSFPKGYKGEKWGKTNSLHHQAIIPTGDINLLAVSELYKDSSKDNEYVAECVSNTEVKFVGVQFHPEEFDTTGSWGKWALQVLKLIE